MRHITKATGALLVGLGLGLLGCGPAVVTAQPGYAPPPPPPPAPTYSGHYGGPGRLDFALTRPMVRQMPPEQHYGSADVYDGGGGSLLTFDVRMFEGGTACRLQGNRTPGGAQLIAGQRCLARMTYDGTPVDVEVQVNEGTASFSAGGVVMGLRGPFVADVHTGTGTFAVAGIAVWRFQGSR